MTYNLTNLTNADGLVEIISAANQLTGGLLMTGIMVMVFFITFISMKDSDTKSVFVVASFISSLIGLGFWALGFIGMTVLIFPFILLGASLIILLTTS